MKTGMSLAVGWKTATLAVVLWVVTLTVWAAVAPAGVIKGPWGLLIGAVFTALAIVAAGYVPGIRDGVLRRRAEQAQLEDDAAAARQALRRIVELPGGGPAQLLDPRRGLVDFVGRERELADLLAWCENGQPRGVRLVAGAGGVGKTRLSVELCAQLEQRGWRWVRVGDQDEAVALQAVRRVWPGLVLLVVDYAETCIGLPDLLREVAADAGTVRVLLLARSAGEWWDRLSGGEPAVRELVAGAGRGEPLPVAVSGELSNVELVVSAVPVFAKALGVTAPSRVWVDVGSSAVRVLDLHAAALVAVLRIVAAGALLGASSRGEAVELLARVPGAVASVKVASWLHELYPPEAGPSQGGGSEALGALRPDRLAERLVVEQLTASQELAERCLSGLDERQALRAVTLLGRAAADEEAAGVLLERVLPLLEQVVAGLPPDVELLAAISAAIPYPSAALAEADLAVTRRILQVLPAGERELRARWLSWLGTTLAQTGRPAEALSAEHEAVGIRRELAAADPDRYRSDLASSLSNLGVSFSELGRPAEALPVTQEAVGIRRELAAADPDRYRSDLAASLTDLGVRFSALGRPADALPADQEAVEIRRELAAAGSNESLAQLAGSLSNLGVSFSELGRPTDALPVTREAVEIYRELAAAYPDRYRPDLAASLTNLGGRLSVLGRPADALPADQEAVEIYRELAAAYPHRYRADLAVSLFNLGNRFLALGRPAEALPVTQETVQIWRELAAADPDQYRADLAASLTNLGGQLLAQGRPAEALPVTQETVQIWRELAAADPDQYRPDLAASLTNLGILFSAQGRPAEALPVTQETVQIWRELAAADPDRYRANLAASLRVRALALDVLGHTAEAEVARRDADLGQ